MTASLFLYLLSSLQTNQNKFVSFCNAKITMQAMQSVATKNSCNCLKNQRHASNVTGQVKLNSKIVNPRRVVPSRKLFDTSSQSVKSYSTGKINGKPVKITKKTTKSDACVANIRPKATIDHCKQCGDVPPHPRLHSDMISSNDLSSRSIKTAIQYGSIREKCPDVNEKLAKSLQQCFRNENFQQTSDSHYNISRTMPPLHSIAELSEKHTSIETKTVKSNVSSDISSLSEGINEINEFRRSNFFECHSAKSRVRHKGSVISPQEHKCVYRFYLNERLFPTPLSSDHIGTIRCIECHLPLKFDDTSKQSQKINGTIQTKVKLGQDKVQDVILMLPVKETLIVKERRRTVQQEDDDVIYFGLVKLSSMGNFKQNIPNDSLALRYQKGFKEHVEDSKCYEYCGDTNDVVII